METKKVALICSATGPYVAFWKNYYDSFKRFFFPGWEKHFYIFTSEQDIYMHASEYVHVQRQDHLPWPLVTLLKFHGALSLKDELLQYDFVLQTNINLVCERMIFPEEMMPRENMGESLCGVIHPGIHSNKKYYSDICYLEYDRNPKSKAYIPYNCGKNYIIGAMVGGSGPNYVDFLTKITADIDDDLKHNIIPKWHDESYLNHFANMNNVFRLLHPMYCYPTGFDVSYQGVIVAVPKEEYFDINLFKGYDDVGARLSLPKRVFAFIKKNDKTRVRPKLLKFRDFILNKRL